MLTDLIIIDDIFPDPDYLVSSAKQFTYFDVFSHSDYSVEALKQLAYYPGYRTKLLNEVDSNLYKYCNYTINNKIVDRAIGRDRNNIEIMYNNRLYFHYMTDEQIFPEKPIFHQDPTMFAGVVYLAKNPSPNSGTIVIHNGKEIVVENKYNRLVLYRGDLLHSVQNTFGKTIHDGRLTLTIFYDKITFDLAFNVQKYINSR